MKKLLWVALFLITAVGIIAGWELHFSKSEMQVIETSFHESSPQAPLLQEQREVERAATVDVPLVDPVRLFDHVQALSYERFSESDRAKTRDYLSKALQEAGLTPRLHEFEGGANVFAERPGTNPQAGSILLAAHYDTVEGSPGADDNASSVAVILEAARLLKDFPTTRTLQVAFFDLEEVGLFGSQAYAADKDRTADLQGAIILDMVGYACYTAGCQRYPAGLPFVPLTNKGDFLAAIGDQEHRSMLDTFQNSSLGIGLPSVLTLPIPLRGLLTPDLLRSDHAPFWYHNIGAVLVTDTANFRSPHYHQTTDTPESLDQLFLAGSAQVIVNGVTALLGEQENLVRSTSPDSEEMPATSL